jgi:acyl-CoA reductase-like NAD-dependent aldehyde dehydrogenase
VHASGFEQARAALKLALAQVRVGPGEQPGCGMGPLIDAPALVAAGVRTEQVLSRCDDVILRGSRGSGPLSDGYFLSPTLVVQHDCAADSAHDEIFGPFVAIGQFEDDSEALACVNAMHQAHSVSLWSGAVARVQPLLQALHHGRVGLNRHNWLAPRTRGAMQLDRRQPCALFDFVALPGEAVNQREVHAYH